MGDKVLFDTNSFIAPFNQYYAPDIVPSYWKQLLVSSPDIMVLDKVRDEIYRGKDELAKWLKSNINQFQVISTDDLRIIEVYGQVIQSIPRSHSFAVTVPLTQVSLETVHDGLFRQTEG